MFRIKVILIGLLMMSNKAQAINKSKPFVFAHRGFSGKYVENSLQAFDQAIKLGVDGVELDVWVCKSGELVVFHDRDLERVTTGNGKILNKTLAELRRLKLANGNNIPTLVEVLELINRKCIVNIELKGPATGAPLAKIIKEFRQKRRWQASDFMVTSFDHPELNKFHTLMPDIYFGPLIDGLLIDTVKYAKDMYANCLSLNFEYVSTRLVTEAHKKGLKVFVYTVNKLEDIKKMQQYGVDGIITNFPNLF